MTAPISRSTSEKATRVAVIGGGITGLAAAHRLVSKSEVVEVTLFESTQRLGGIIRTEEADGFLLELGPDSFITNKPGGLQLCGELGYTEQLIPTDSRYRRSLVLRRGKPMAVPDGFMLMAPARPWAIMTTPVLSLSGKLRLLSEAFRPRRKNTEDESLASFVRRRFGKEALDRLIQPLVGGIYTSDPERLSLKATMPRFLEMEQAYGSVIRATLAQQKSTDSEADTSGSGARYGLFATAAKGLGDLVKTLEACLRSSGRIKFRLGCPVQEVVPPAVDGSGWAITSACSAERMSFDAIILTQPTHLAARILCHSSMSVLAHLLGVVEYASSAVVVSGHALKDFTHPMDAFGLVIPAIERRNILAVSFSSRKFLNRAPEGHILLRTFIGGALQPELMQRDNEEMVSTVNKELKDLLGMQGEPLFSEVMRYEKAMPQYHVGHLDLVAKIEAEQSRFPGLQLAGSAYHGVGIPDSIASGRNAADAIFAASL